MAFLCPFSSAQRLSNSLFPSGDWQKRGNFHPFSLKGHVCINIYRKSQEHWKIAKTVNGSSSRTDLSNCITVSQSQSLATVPLSNAPNRQSTNRTAPSFLGRNRLFLPRYQMGIKQIRMHIELPLSAVEMKIII